MSDIDKELTRALNGRFTLAMTLELDSAHRYVVFSDQHKGAGDKADEFRKCKGAYVAALEDYRARGFTLILLGDVEELWEQGFREVAKEYDAVLRLEGSFGPGRYLRVWGNHDDRWMDDKAVDKLLAQYMPVGSVYEGLRFEVHRSGTWLGRMFMAHGHQGTFEADKLRWIARYFLRFYRLLQRWFGIGKTTPAKDACLRGEHDQQMYEWAATQGDLLMVAGHTHRPVWSSKTHLQKLEAQLEDLKSQPPSPERDEQIKKKEAEIEERRKKVGDCNDLPKPKPCYFNTGCCKFDDGDITGIELEDGTLRLVKWTAAVDAGPGSQRIVLEEDAVENVFAKL